MAEHDARDVVQQFLAVTDLASVDQDLALAFDEAQRQALTKAVVTENHRRKGKIALAVTDKILHDGSPERGTITQYIQSFEKVGLALSVGPCQHDASSIGGDHGINEVPEIPKAYRLEAHQSICMGMMMWK